MILELSDVIKKAGFSPSEVMLIRHPLSNPHFSACYAVIYSLTKAKEAFQKFCVKEAFSE